MQVWFSNRRARLRKQLTGQQLGSMSLPVGTAFASAPSSASAPAPTPQFNSSCGIATGTEQVSSAALAAAFQTHSSAGGWQQHAGSYPLNYNGYGAAGSLHQDASAPFHHQFQGYSAAIMTANHLAAHPHGWNRSGGNKAESVTPNCNTPAGSSWSAPMTEPYPFFASASAHHHHHHHTMGANPAGSAFLNAHSSHPHSPTEPKSGYPYYGHQISGMEASMLCAGLVH